MEKVISIEEYKKKQIINITWEDMFNLFLIFARDEESWATIDLNVLMESFAKYKNMERFASLYGNLEIEKNENGIDIIDLYDCLEQKIKSKTIVINPSRKNEFVILGTDEEFDQLRGKYDNRTLTIFRDLMFFIHMDLEYGINNWSLLAEDEYIEDQNYPGIVTGEFIGKEKNERIMKKVRKRAIERLRNLYK